MWRRYRVLDYVMLLVAACVGYAAGPRWFILLAAVGLSIDEGVKLWLQLASGDMPSSKAITYVVTGCVANLGYAALSYFAGLVLRAAT